MSTVAGDDLDLELAVGLTDILVEHGWAVDASGQSLHVWFPTRPITLELEVRHHQVRIHGTPIGQVITGDLAVAARVVADTFAALDPVRACVGCGCTDDHACPFGCWWVSLDPPLCSTCT